MPHCSTTATSTYLLGKYSKSYPTQRDSRGALQADSETNTSEWQHFTNPTIRLILDVKQNGKGLESVRLRIIWIMDSGITSNNNLDQREVVFEDIDLLSLSCNSLRRPQNQQQLQGLPLKAVYRDTVVGIRYLHECGATAVPIYRRFQITFMSSSAVLEFIDAIRSVCPCKANPSAGTGRNPTFDTRVALGPSTSVRSLTNGHIINGDFALPSNHVPPTRSTIQFPARIATMTSQPFYSSPLQKGPQTNISALNVEECNPPSSSMPAIRNFESDLSVPKKAIDDSECVDQNPHKRKARPDSSSSITTTIHTVNPDSDIVLPSLRESSFLYDLPQSTLENLVGDIVREDSFPRWRLLHRCGKLKDTWVSEIDIKLQLVMPWLQNIGHWYWFTQRQLTSSMLVTRTS